MKEAWEPPTLRHGWAAEATECRALTTAVQCQADALGERIEAERVSLEEARSGRGRAWLRLPGERWLVLWSPGSGLGLHDHAGSAGSVRVLAGALDELWRLGPVGPLAARRLTPRDGRTRLAADHVHAVAAPRWTLTLHRYETGLDGQCWYAA